MPLTQKVPELSDVSPYLWCAEPVDGGILYLNDSPSAKAGTELLRHVLEAGKVPADVEIMEPGAFGRTYAQGNTVIKQFWVKNGKMARDPNVSGLGYLRVSAALHSGLIAVTATLPPELRSRDGVDFEYAAPEIFGAFVPDSGEKGRGTIVAMSRAQGDGMKFWGNETPHPTYRMRRQVYRQALGSIGVNPGEVFFDPKPDNTLLHQIAEDKVQVTRIDVTARTPFRK